MKYRFVFFLGFISCAENESRIQKNRIQLSSLKEVASTDFSKSSSENFSSSLSQEPTPLPGAFINTLEEKIDQEFEKRKIKDLGILEKGAKQVYVPQSQSCFLEYRFKGLPMKVFGDGLKMETTQKDCVSWCEAEKSNLQKSGRIYFVQDEKEWSSFFEFGKCGLEPQREQKKVENGSCVMGYEVDRFPIRKELDATTIETCENKCMETFAEDVKLNEALKLHRMTCDFKPHQKFEDSSSLNPPSFSSSKASSLGQNSSWDSFSLSGSTMRIDEIPNGASIRQFMVGIVGLSPGNELCKVMQPNYSVRACSGSIITDSVILTSSSCYIPGWNYYAVFKSKNVKEYVEQGCQDPHYWRVVKPLGEWLPYPFYRDEFINSDNYKRVHDIAMVRLPQGIPKDPDFTRSAIPIANSQMTPFSEGVVTRVGGYGSTEPDSWMNLGWVRRGEKPLASETWERNAPVLKAVPNGVEACWGDTGAPLWGYGGGLESLHLFGVGSYTSLRNKCNLGETDYVDVRYYHPWFNDAFKMTCEEGAFPVNSYYYNNWTPEVKPFVTRCRMEGSPCEVSYDRSWLGDYSYEQQMMFPVAAKKLLYQCTRAFHATKEVLGSPGNPPINIYISRHLPANVSGWAESWKNGIEISSNALASGGFNDPNVLVHELSHVQIKYDRSPQLWEQKAGFTTNSKGRFGPWYYEEGLVEYTTSYALGLQPLGREPGCRIEYGFGHYKDGYWCTEAFIAYITHHLGHKDFPKQLYQALMNTQNPDTLIKNLTGKDPDVLFGECVMTDYCRNNARVPQIEYVRMPF